MRDLPSPVCAPATLPVILAFLMPACLYAPPIVGEDSDGSLALRVTLDKTSYARGETILLEAWIKGRPGKMLRLSDARSGADGFHVLIGEVASGKPWISSPVADMQFLPASQSVEPREWGVKIISGFSKQLVLCGKHLEFLPPGEYWLRIGYSLDSRKLRALIKNKTDFDVSVNGHTYSRFTLEEYYGGAVLSEPINFKVLPRSMPPVDKPAP